jgi:hypothetical protein
MGLSWRNISDGYFKTGSIGAVAVAESDPNVVYVGMGEHAVRGVMTHHGDGVYRSTDAGKTWTPEEDERLLAGFDGGASVEALATAHERTRAGIEARLVKHGRLEAEQAGAARMR